MIALLTCGLVLILMLTITHWIAATSLLRTLSASIDCWADSVHGGEAEPS